MFLAEITGNRMRERGRVIYTQKYGIQPEGWRSLVVWIGELLRASYRSFYFKEADLSKILVDLIPPDKDDFIGPKVPHMDRCILLILFDVDAGNWRAENDIADGR